MARKLFWGTWAVTTLKDKMLTKPSTTDTQKRLLSSVSQHGRIRRPTWQIMKGYRMNEEMAEKIEERAIQLCKLEHPNRIWGVINPATKPDIVTNDMKEKYREIAKREFDD